MILPVELHRAGGEFWRTELRKLSDRRFVPGGCSVGCHGNAPNARPKRSAMKVSAWDGGTCRVELLRRW